MHAHQFHKRCGFPTLFLSILYKGAVFHMKIQLILFKSLWNANLKLLHTLLCILMSDNKLYIVIFPRTSEVILKTTL